MTGQKQYAIWETKSVEGSNALKSGNLDQAEALYSNALAIAEKIAEKSSAPLEILLLAISYSQMGDVKREGKDFPSAVAFYDKGIEQAQKAIDAVPATIAKLAGIQEYEKNLGILYLKSGLCYQKNEEERKNRIFWATKIFEKINKKADCKEELALCYRLEKQMEME